MKHPETDDVRNSNGQLICGDWVRQRGVTCSLTRYHLGDHKAHSGHVLRESVMYSWPPESATDEEVQEAIKSILEVRREE